ncbi:MAG: HesA/MoeB/ThiF family protein [Promethearchaeota archaeon]
MLTNEQKQRYSRQIISPSIGEKGQEKLSKIRVLQIGAGGLGSPFSLYLVASGIKELTIIDNDTISISNLQRQILYNEKQIGKDKVSMAKKTLSKLNSDVKINVHEDYINDKTIRKYVDQVDKQDFIVDCSDNLETKFLVNRTAIEYDMKCVIAGIKDFYGQIMTIIPRKTACYECVFNEPENFKSKEDPLPVIGVTPGILGTLEALEVIKTTLGLPNLENKLLMVNLLNLSFDSIDIVKNERCKCSLNHKK